MAKKDCVARAVETLRRGGLVALPTETVYGLAARALEEPAVARVFAAKGRPPSNPLIVHVSDVAMARRVVDRWTLQAQALADAFWPGPLTIVLPKAAHIPDLVTAGGSTVAVRCPAHIDAREVISRLGEPVVAPSANLSGFVSPTRAEHVRGVWDEDEVYVFDGGACDRGIESTVVELDPDERDPPCVLRLGSVPIERMASVLGVQVAALDRTDGHGSARSPGLIGPHYKPNASLVISHANKTHEASAAVVRLPSNGAAAARDLYAMIRDADEGSPPVIVVVVPHDRDGAEWDAIMDRLLRAAQR